MRMKALIHLKQTLAMAFHINAQPIVFYGKYKVLLVQFGGNFNHGSPLWRPVFKCVADEVVENTNDHRAHGIKDACLRKVDVELNIQRLLLSLQHKQDGIQFVGEVDLLTNTENIVADVNNLA